LETKTLNQLKKLYFESVDRYHFWKQKRQYKKYNDFCWKRERECLENGKTAEA
jgi:hypothetical protein